MFTKRVGDNGSTELAKRLELAAASVPPGQAHSVRWGVERSVFVSHTSRDFGGKYAELEFMKNYLNVFEAEPFMHNLRTGGADAYEKIVGLALLSAKRVLVVWSRNALRSDYVRAEMLLARRFEKPMAAFLLPGAPRFPFEGTPAFGSGEKLKDFLSVWNPI